MKRTIFLLTVLCMLAVTKAMAYDWTDNSGVKWTFSQQTFTIGGEQQKLWTITAVSNYSENVVVPETVVMSNRVWDSTTRQYVDVTEEVTIEAIGNNDSSSGYAFVGSGNKSSITAVTLPATIKYIGYGAFRFYAGTVTMKGSTPPALGVYISDSPNFSAGITILVPAESLEAYRTADGWADYAVRVISQSAKASYDVSVAAQANGSGLHTAIGEDNLGNVMSLKVRGTINSYDIMIMRNKMHNLHHLDLTDASVLASSYEYYQTYHTTDNAIGDYAFYQMQKLMTVKLPKTITAIGQRAFQSCYGLRTVEFQDGLESIGQYAFNYCYSLQGIALKKGLKTIADYAFWYTCVSSANVTLEECQTIGSYAFRNCSMSTLTIGECQTIGREAFSNCSMSTLTIGECQTIGSYAFSNCRMSTLTIGECQNINSNAFGSCSGLTNINLPEGLKSIGSSAFYSCSALPAITIPKGVTTIGGSAFSGCRKLAAVAFPTTLKTIESSTFEDCTSLTAISLPTSLTTIGSSAFKGCTALTELHIPATINSIGGSAFSGCTALKDIYTYTVEPTTINQNTFSCWTVATLHVPYFAYNNYYWDTQWSQFAFLTEFGRSYEYDYFYINHDFYFTEQTGVVEGVPDAELNAGSGLIVGTTTSTLRLNDVHLAKSATMAASIMASGNMQLNKLYFDVAVTKNKWFFLSVPFRVKLANVTSPGDYVFRYYDGATRAQNGSGGWKNVETAYLNPGQGYIFQTNADGTLTLEVELADMSLDDTDRSVTLNTYTAEQAANASWNYVGNPHTTYYDINATGYSAPITVWNGTSYQALRPGDDQYYLQPMEAFFVQKPATEAAISFPASGRYTYQQMQEKIATATTRATAPETTARYLIDLTIATDDDTTTDQTRVVYNEAKATDYEADCDAAKFLSGDTPAQLYTLDRQGTQYAINERPRGEVAVGYVAAAKGLLTISATRMDCAVLLRDRLTGTTHDLAQAPYTFSTDAGTCNDRFTLTFDGSTTAIASATGQGQQPAATSYDLQGRRYDNRQPQAGQISIVKQGTEARKVVSK